MPVSTGLLLWHTDNADPADVHGVGSMNIGSILVICVDIFLIRGFTG